MPDGASAGRPRGCSPASTGSRDGTSTPGRCPGGAVAAFSAEHDVERADEHGTGQHGGGCPAYRRCDPHTGLIGSRASGRSRSGVRDARCPEWDSNPHWMVFETIGSASWPIGARGSSCHPPLGSPGGRREAPGGDRRGRGADPARPARDARGRGLRGRGRGRRRRDGGRAGRPSTGRTWPSSTSRCPGWTASPRPSRSRPARLAPVVMLTAFSQRELVERARAAGAMAYLVKPFTKADLVPAVEMAMARYDELVTLEREVVRPARAAGDPQAGRPGQGRAAGPARAGRGGGVPLGPAHLDGPPAEHARRSPSWC